MEIRIPGADVADVALEVLDVHDVEADDRCVETDVRFGDRLPEVVWACLFGGLIFQVGFRLVEGGEELADGFLVGFLRGGEAGFVDPVVDVVVSPFVGGLDLGAEVGGEEVDVAVLLGEKGVEFGVKHADDFGGFVGDDCVVPFVPEGGDREAAFVGWVHGEVQVAEVGVFWVEGVRVGEVTGDGGFFVGGHEAPAWVGE